jgi:hypothetical protein
MADMPSLLKDILKYTLAFGIYEFEEEPLAPVRVRWGAFVESLLSNFPLGRNNENGAPAG